jgi:hypothetical protein
MWIIKSPEQIDEFERRNGLVSVYLDNGYNPNVVDMFSEIMRPFDEHVGSAWHLLVPVMDGYLPTGSIRPGDYNLQMARAIAQSRGIPLTKLPALVFEFIPQREYYFVSLAGMEPERIRNIVLHIGEIAVDEFKGGARDLAEFRAAAHGRIVRYLWGEKALSFMSDLGPAIAAAIGAVASVQTLR